MIIEKTTRGRTTRNPGSERLYELYVVQNLTARQIAEMYGVAEGTVRGWIYRLNKEVRSKEV